MIAGAIPLMLSISLAAGDAARGSCESAMRRRDEAFRPLAAEMKILREHDRRLGVAAGRPPLQLAERYGAFDEKLKAFDRRYPYRDCAKSKSYADH